MTPSILLLSIPVGIAESHIPGHPSARERERVHMNEGVLHFYLCASIRVLVCVCRSHKLKGLWPQLQLPGPVLNMGKLDKLYCPLGVSQTTSGGEIQGSEG